MRKIVLASMLLCAVLTTQAQNGEEQNVKNVIQAQLDAYKNRDAAKYAATWHQGANSSNTYISRDGYVYVKGWDSLNATLKRDLENNTGNIAKFDVENYSVEQDGNIALANYELVLTPVTDHSAIFPYMGVIRYHVYQAMMKEDGDWKTTTRIITLPDSYNGTDKHVVESDLNNVGYELLSIHKVPEAIEVFKLNVKFFPDSWNTYDSLGEAYAIAGNNKLAIENYEKSVKMNPKSESGPPALAKLKAKKSF